MVMNIAKPDSETLARIKEELQILATGEHDKSIIAFEYVSKQLEQLDFTGNELAKIDILEGQIRYYLSLHDHEAVEKLLDIALDYATQHKLEDSLDRIHNTRAIALATEGHYFAAIEIWERLLIGDITPMFRSNLLNNLVIGYGNTRQFAKAIDMAYDLLDLLESLGAAERMNSAYMSLGNAYRQASQIEKAREAYEKALVLAEEHNDAQVTYMAKNNLSLALSDLGQYEEALRLAFEGLELRKKYFGESNLSLCYNNIGTIYSHIKDYDKSLEYFHKGLSLFQPGFLEDSKANCLALIAKSYLEKGDLDNAMQYAIRSQQIAAKLDLVKLDEQIYKVFATIYAKTGKHDQALELANKHIELLNDKITELSENMISKTEASYLRRKLEEQSESVRLQNAELHNSNQLIQQKSKELSKTNKDLNETITMLDTLVRVISHDVRGPVSTSAVLLRMILEGEFTTEDKDNFLRDMTESLDETADLLSQMLIWIEANKHSSGLSHLKRQVDLAGILNSVVKMYNAQLKQKKINLNYKPWEGNLLIKSEPNALKTVFRNIVSNAVKFTCEGGEISITVSEEEPWATVVIRDTGVGMTPDEIEKLLAQSMVSKEGTMKEFGMGIGLKLSLNYLKLLGADLKIESSKGYGTSFIVRLPKNG